jgi:glycosyltransferase involved in cell wall biosynthesis
MSSRNSNPALVAERAPTEGPAAPAAHGARRFRLLHFQVAAVYGGDESNSLILCRELRDFDHQVAVYFGAGPMADAWRGAGAEVTLLDLPPRPRRELIDAVRRTVESARPDGVFLSSVVLLPLVLKGLGSFAGPVLCHTGNPDHSGLSTRLKFLLARWLLRPAVVPVMVHCSEYVSASYQRSPGYRHYVHKVAVSAGLAAGSGAPARHIPRRVTTDSAVRVGMLARLDPIKNHALVIRAFAALLESYPGATLEFVGEGSELGALRALAAGLGIADRVVLRGRVAAPFEILAGWDLFLYATTRDEGFGAALAEAMSVGLPSVVTDIGPMREVGGDAVRYVDPADPRAMAAAAASLLGDFEGRAAMSRSALERARAEFDGARFAGKIRSALEAEHP